MSFDLNTLWFLLVGVLLTGYAVLDGFDLGVGALHLLTREDEERRILINAIGPVWDGNEVWLVTGGGALFAAFPEVYASVFSGFYLAFMALLATLIFRAVAIEFRSKQPSRRWRRGWDVAFAVGSTGASLLIGVALGNVAQGVPLDAQHQYFGGLVGLLRPYPLLVGVTTVALFAMHGNIYLLLKTEGALQAKLRRWMPRTIALFMLMYGLTSVATVIYLPHMTKNLFAHPWLFVIPVLNVLTVLDIPREIAHGHEGRAFVASCASMGLLLLLFGVGLYPNLVYAAPDVAHSLNIYNSSSSPRTLGIMAIMAALGVPVVLAYTISIYWIFRGKVRLDEHSY